MIFKMRLSTISRLEWVSQRVLSTAVVCCMCLVYKMYLRLLTLLVALHHCRVAFGVFHAEGKYPLHRAPSAEASHTGISNTKLRLVAFVA